MQTEAVQSSGQVFVRAGAGQTRTNIITIIEPKSATHQLKTKYGSQVLCHRSQIKLVG